MKCAFLSANRYVHLCEDDESFKLEEACVIVHCF